VTESFLSPIASEFPHRPPFKSEISNLQSTSIADRQDAFWRLHKPLSNLKFQICSPDPSPTTRQTQPKISAGHTASFASLFTGVRFQSVRNRATGTIRTAFVQTPTGTW